VTEDDAGEAGEVDAGDPHVAGVELNHVPDRRIEELQVRIVGEHREAVVRELGRDDPFKNY